MWNTLYNNAPILFFLSQYYFWTVLISNNGFVMIVHVPHSVQSFFRKKRVPIEHKIMQRNFLHQHSFSQSSLLIQKSTYSFLKVHKINKLHYCSSNSTIICIQMIFSTSNYCFKTEANNLIERLQASNFTKV